MLFGVRKEKVSTCRVDICYLFCTINLSFPGGVWRSEREDLRRVLSWSLSFTRCYFSPLFSVKSGCWCQEAYLPSSLISFAIPGRL